jgi:hypothetical protein
VAGSGITHQCDVKGMRELEEEFGWDFMFEVNTLQLHQFPSVKGGSGPFVWKVMVSSGGIGREMTYHLSLRSAQLMGTASSKRLGKAVLSRKE